MALKSPFQGPPNEGSSWYQNLLDTAKNRKRRDTDAELKVFVDDLLIAEGVVMEFGVDFPGGTRIVSGYTEDVHATVCRRILNIPTPDPLTNQKNNLERMAKQGRRNAAITAISCADPGMYEFEQVMRWARDEGLDHDAVYKAFDDLTVKEKMTNASLNTFYAWCVKQVEALRLAELKQTLRGDMQPGADELENAINDATCPKCNDMRAFCLCGLDLTHFEKEEKAVDTSKEEFEEGLIAGGAVVDAEVVEDEETAAEALDTTLMELTTTQVSQLADKLEVLNDKIEKIQGCGGADEHEDGTECWLGCGYGAMPKQPDAPPSEAKAFEHNKALIDGSTGEVINQAECWTVLNAIVPDADEAFEPNTPKKLAWMVGTLRRVQLVLEDRLFNVLKQTHRELKAYQGLVEYFKIVMTETAIADMPKVSRKGPNKGKPKGKAWRGPDGEGGLFFVKTGGPKIVNKSAVYDWVRKNVTVDQHAAYGVTLEMKVDLDVIKKRVAAGEQIDGAFNQPVNEWGRMSIGGDKAWSFSGAKRRAKDEIKRLELRGDTDSDDGEGTSEPGADED